MVSRKVKKMQERMRKREANWQWWLTCIKSTFVCIVLLVLLICLYFRSPSQVQEMKICDARLALQDPEISGEIFVNPEGFFPDYQAMEKRFRIFMYPFQTGCPTLHGEIEDYFLKNIMKSAFLTSDPEDAQLFFIHVPCKQREARQVLLFNAVQNLISKYPYWNRTLGADHFFVSCADFARKTMPFLMKNLIRVVCSPSYGSEYIAHKDVSLLPLVESHVDQRAGENNLKERVMLAFWAGNQKSDIRNKLVATWTNDAELDIQTNKVVNLNKRIKRRQKFYQSKFCICPGGSPLNGAHITTAIHYGCVPVITSDHYDLPFNGIFDWSKFSLIVKENEIHMLKKMLKNITDAEYITLQNNTLKVQKHFRWNSSPTRLDAFHLVMYELWLRRHVVRYTNIIEHGANTLWDCAYQHLARQVARKIKLIRMATC